MSDDAKVGCGAAALVAVLLFVVWSVLFNNINQGEVGIITTWGKADNQTLDPGFHWVWPIAQAMTKISTRVQTPDFTRIDAATKELQSVQLTGKIAYVVDARNAVKLFSNVAGDQTQIEPKLIDPALQTFMKEVTAQYTATCDTTRINPANQQIENVPPDPNCKALVPSRELIRTAARQKLQENLSQYGIDIRDVYLSNFKFSDQYEKAIENKQAAVQEAQRAALQVGVANNEAQAAIAKANGEAQANKVREASINQELINYLYAQAFGAKWDGRLPIYGNGSGSIILNPGTAPSPKP